MSEDLTQKDALSQDAEGKEPAGKETASRYAANKKGKKKAKKKTAGSGGGSTRVVAIVLVAALLLGAVGVTAYLTKGFGIWNPKTVFTINGQTFDTEDYYLQLYMTKRKLLNTGDILPSSTLQQKLDNSNTVEMVLKDSVESALKVTAAVNAMAKERNIKLNDADTTEIKKQKDAFVTELGGKDALKNFVESNRTSEKALDRYFRANALLTRLEKELYSEGKAFDLTDEERATAQQEYYAKYAKYSYIRFLLVDNNGAALSEVRKQQQRTLASEAHEKAQAGADFNKLIDEYSDDASSQKGKYESYTLKGTTTDEYDELLFGTPVGGVSAVKELANGLVIIKRLQLDDTKINDYFVASRQAKMQTEISAKAKSFTALPGDEFSKIIIR